MPLLEVRDLSVGYRTFRGILRVVERVSFSLSESESLSLVGESGSGKTTILKAVLGALPRNAIVEGSIVFNGRNLEKISSRERMRLLGTEIAYIPQEPLSALNPLFTVEEHFVDRIILRGRSDISLARYLIERRRVPEKARERMIEALKMARIGEPERVLRSYPFQLSGGMLQRVLIAMAISYTPKLLLADEPTTALDVITQKDILLLLRDLQRKLGMSILYVTHDFRVARMISDRILVLYAGQQFEEGPADDIIHEPLHPYTRDLMEAIPRLTGKGMKPIEGGLPDYLNPPPGCRFHPRCRHAMDICREKLPPEVKIGSKRVRCWLYSIKYGGAGEGS